MFFIIFRNLFNCFPYLIYVMTGPGFWTCCPLACLCYSDVGVASRGFTHLLGHLARGTGACAGSLCLAVWGVWPSRVLGGASAGGFGGRSSSWGMGPARVPCLGGWGLEGSVGCCPWFSGASALCLWGLCLGASSTVFWVDAWLFLRWASRVLCSVGAADVLGLVALSACF